MSSLLIKAEKLIRELIEKEMSKAYPNTWTDIINNIFADRKDHYLKNLLTTALQNDFSSSNISKLNVISFMEYFDIINNNWDKFSKYFSVYPNIDAVYAAMKSLNDSRNTSAHLNLAIYNGENRRKLRETCELLISCLESASDVSIDSDILTMPTAGAIVTFCCQAIKMPKRNLRGIIKEYDYPAGVAQKNLAAFCFESEPKIGDEFTAVIERWDSNAKMFNLKAPCCEVKDHY